VPSVRATEGGSTTLGRRRLSRRPRHASGLRILGCRDGERVPLGWLRVREGAGPRGTLVMPGSGLASGRATRSVRVGLDSECGLSKLQKRRLHAQRRAGRINAADTQNLTRRRYTKIERNSQLVSLWSLISSILILITPVK
jgi:hypothetical protein